MLTFNWLSNAYLLFIKKDLQIQEQNISLLRTVGMGARTCTLGLRPYLIMWIRPRRNKRVDRPWNGGSHTEKGGRVQSEEVNLLR